MKPVIITITFSPCLDKSTAVEALVPDIKMKCAEPHVEAGGGGINVSRALMKLGVVSHAIYASGGYTGKHFDALMRGYMLDSTIIETATDTRENLIVFDSNSNKQYRFGMPLPALTAQEWPQFLGELENTSTIIDFIVISGSLPANPPEGLFAEIAEIARRKKAKLVVDTTGSALRQAIEAGVYLIKPNLGELALLAGKKVLTPEETRETALSIINSGKCAVVVVSMGSAGAMLVSREIVCQFRPPEVDRKSTVGAGDSMVAGLVYALASGKALIDAVQYGVACGTAATLNAGTELCRKADADALMPLVSRM